MARSAVLWVARAELLLLAAGLAISAVQSIPNPGLARREPWPMLVFAAIAVIHGILAFRLASDSRARSATVLVLGAWTYLFLIGALVFPRLPIYVMTLDRPGSFLLLLALVLLTGGTALGIRRVGFTLSDE